MSFKALVYAYVLGGLTFLPLLICAAIAWTIYTSVPVGDPDPAKLVRKKLAEETVEENGKESNGTATVSPRVQHRSKRAWLTVRRTFEERETDATYMGMMRTFLDARSKDPKRSRPKDMWYVVLKGNVLYLYEDEAMTECEAAVQVSSHEVVVYPEGLQDGELFTRRNGICLKPRENDDGQKGMNSVTREMALMSENVDEKVEEMDGSEKQEQRAKEKLEDVEKMKVEAKSEAFDASTPWFIFVRSCVEMEDWYLSLVHASNYHSASSILEPVEPVFKPGDMQFLVSTLDDQPDVIPMRWLNALIGRIFFSFYRTEVLESFIIGRLMKKLSKVKTPSFLQNISVTEVSVGTTPPTLSKPMLKELTREGDAALEVRLMYRGEIRLTVEATAIINLGQRFKTYTVKLVLAVVLRKLDGNLLIKVKRPPTNRIWYAFTQPPDMVLDVEPVVSDRQIKWSMILSTIESRLKEIINESVVLPNMDDIAFFESKRYRHRGGIWGDASRKERIVSEVMDGQQKSTTVADNSNGNRAQSVDVLLTSSTGPILNSIDSDSDTGIKRASTVAAPEQKTWSNSTRSTDTNSLGTPTGEEAQEPSTSSEDRGRGLTVEAPGRRATSVPVSKSGSGSNSPAENDEATPVVDMQESATFSRLRSLSSGAGMNTPPDARDALNQGTSKDSLSANSLGTSSNAPTNASSILSALKSKDKQALNAAAKEAMRKWSANWNGFKRGRMGTGGESGSQDDHIDGAPQSATSSIFSFPTSEGRSYADIRTAVASRKDKKEHESVSQERPEGSSKPINIPTKKANTDESADDYEALTPLSHPRDKDFDVNPSTPPQSNSSSPRGPSLLRKESNRAAPSPPKVTTESHISDATQVTTPSNDQHQQTHAPASFAPPPSPPLQAPPIKTQPSQAAMMMIPGIHASHRGDVMSMGYVAPSPSPPPTEHKLRTPTIPPTIQNMYRLFKSPTSGGSALQRQQQHPPNAPTEPSVDAQGSPRGTLSEQPKSLTDANEDVVPLTLSPTALNAPSDKALASVKLIPPPLPPRTTPTSPSSASMLPRPESGQSLNTLTLSASDALKLVAEQDEAKRRSLDASAVEGKTVRSKRNSLGAKRISRTEIPQELLAPDLQHGTAELQSGSTAIVNATDEMSQAEAREDVSHKESHEFGEQTGWDETSVPSHVEEANTNGVHVNNQPELPKRTPPPLPPRKPSLSARA